MSIPKSVTKMRVKKGNVDIKYVSNLDQCEYYLFELNRAALRDVAKFFKVKYRAEFYKHFKRKTGKAPRLAYRVWSNKKTLYPRVQIGLMEGQRNFYGYYQEFGSRNFPKLGLLQNIARENISTIVEIESKYLSQLSKDRPFAYLHEKDYGEE